MTPDLCPHEQYECVVTQVRHVDVDRDEDVYVLVPDDFSDPDYVDVEIYCKACGQNRLLSASEWEVA